MQRRYANLKIAQKMMTVFLAICILSLVLASVVISYASMNRIEQKTAVFAQVVNAQVASNMEQLVSSYQGLIMSVLVDSEVLSALARDTVPVAERAEYYTQVNKLLFRLIKMQPSVVYAGIILKNGESFQTGMTGEAMDVQALMQSSWMKKIVDGSQTFNIVPMHSADYINRYGHGSVISVVQKLFGPSRQYVGVIVLDIETEALVDLGDESLVRENIQDIRVVVENRSHQILYDSETHSDEEWMDEDGFFLFDRADSGFVINSVEAQEGELIVHTIYPRESQLLMQRELLGITLLTVLICILFSALCAFLFSRSFTRPIQQLRGAIHRTEQEQYAIVEGDFRQDEFGDLIRDYNHMVEHIEYLIRQVYQSDLQKKSAQLTALQTQINPHMMFNTLESIRMKALMAGNQEVAEMIWLMAKMMRTALENVNERHTILDELEYAKSFVRLQNMRLKVENELTIQMPEDLMDIPCLVILFQPLIENSLSHGRKSMTQSLRIKITGNRIPDTDLIQFLVEDNGVGMDPDKLMIIADRLELIQQGEITMNSYVEDGRAHIGLENIAKRIHLQYGGEAGLRIAYSNNHGTGVEIRIRDLSTERQGRQ